MPLQERVLPQCLSAHSQLPARGFPTPGCPAAGRFLPPLFFSSSRDGTTRVKAGWRLPECHQTKLGLRLAARHCRPPPDSWGVRAQGGPTLPSSLLGAARWHPEGWKVMPAPPADLSDPVVDRWLSTGRCVCQSLKIKLLKGGGEVWIQAATAGALGRLCLGDAQRESTAFPLCSLARVLS